MIPESFKPRDVKYLWYIPPSLLDRYEYNVR